MSIPDVVDSLPDFVDRDITSMLPVETRPNIAEALCTKAFLKTMLPYYLFFRVVKKIGIAFLAKDFWDFKDHVRSVSENTSRVLKNTP